ncbi:hypothetical protein [Tenacibaculum caenipelagi]|uniref:Uncharacterized protein n=1 Tax=Tenacibaculum caenipelagi TaxID=1325435 RepID=A0A4R6TCC5_9FLAO|nr:hypothetical protein [Tenacibaculum caenipelagi]TDQ24054.1 hypothetical protein DFQ07_2597 [Tenacibaculum caenipelagi]
MKKVAPYFLALTLSIVFASCSNNDTEVLDDTPENLLQSYTLKRDASGAYSIDFNTSSNTDVTTVTNTDNSKEIILAETAQKTATKHSNDFSIDNEHLKIGFLETNNGKQTNIWVKDENITFAKGITEFLNSYSVTANEDGTYQLDFVVNDNVATEFSYNEDIEAYEVHLSNNYDTENAKTFSRTMSSSDNGIIKINFVNHKYSGKTVEEELANLVTKPEVIIQS